MGSSVADLSLIEGFWCPKELHPSIMSFKKHFQALDTDIIITSNPKCGTTWLKALIFSIVNRTRYTPSNTPLLTSVSHDLVPYLEFHLYNGNQVPDLTTIPSPRLFATHVPFPALPESIKKSKCRIVYIGRNPFDSALSYWHLQHELFNQGLNAEIIPMDKFLDMYFEGLSMYGPYWDNVLGYWKESLEKPDKVLFLKYEDMKEDIVSCLKKIAEFIKYSFTEEEERDGVIQEIAKLCCFSNLKNLEVNKKGAYLSKFPNSAYFRKGEVGNWIDHISPSKKQQLEKVMEEKFRGTGLSFKLSI